MGNNHILRFSLFLLILFLILFGTLMVWSSSAFLAMNMRYGSITYFIKQMMWITIGLGLLLTLQNVDYLHYKKWAKILLLISLVSLGFVLLSPWGVTRHGAQRWLNLGFVTIQPSEFVKIAMIIYIADVLTRKQKELDKFWKTVFPLICFIGMVLTLIVLEPNRSTTIFIFLLSGALWFAAGGRIKHILVVSLVFFISVSAVIFISPNARLRVINYMNQDSNALGGNYQLEQSKIAMASGGLRGIGLGESRQKHSFLPEPHTDFIFSIIAEELGYIGSICIIAAYTFLIIIGYNIAVRSPELFGCLVAAGITIMIGGQATLNLAVVVGLCPTTGVALPFLSYGGSSMIVNLASMGILLNIAKYAET